MAKKQILSPSQLALLCYQMSIVFKSGIPLVQGMVLIGEEIEEKGMKNILNQINQELAGACKIYEAFEKQDVFPTYMVKMIQIGEYSGSMDTVMRHLSHYYKKIDQMNKRLQNAITYPLILMTLMLVIIGILFVKVLPMFKDILESIGGDMPLFTSYVLSLSDGLRQGGFYFLGITLAVVIGWGVYVKTPKGKTYMDKLKLEAPFFKKIYVKIYAAKFSETLSLLLKSGISYSEALQMVAGVVGNVHLEVKILEYQRHVMFGEDDDEFFKRLGIFPNLMVQMIKIGYRTGELDNIMKEVAEIYETEVDMELNRLAATVEPMLIIFLSLIVGVILLTVMLPLINLMSTIGN